MTHPPAGLPQALPLVRRSGTPRRWRLEDVGGRDDPLEVAILVMHKRHRHLGLAQCIQHIESINRVGNDRRLPHPTAHVEGLVPEEGG